jgi:hypothetical protein
VAEDFFGDYPELTPEEVDEYAKLAHSWVDGLLEAENSSEVNSDFILQFHNNNFHKKNSSQDLYFCTKKTRHD